MKRQIRQFMNGISFWKSQGLLQYLGLQRMDTRWRWGFVRIPTRSALGELSPQFVWMTNFQVVRLTKLRCCHPRCNPLPLCLSFPSQSAQLWKENGCTIILLWLFPSSDDCKTTPWFAPTKCVDCWKSCTQGPHAAIPTAQLRNAWLSLNAVRTPMIIQCLSTARPGAKDAHFEGPVQKSLPSRYLLFMCHVYWRFLWTMISRKLIFVQVGTLHLSVLAILFFIPFLFLLFFL